MINTPKGLRLHIGVFGRRNVGKSSILNKLVNQDISIVSDTPGTTTDPVEKVMELKPIGPVVFIDTAGIDDIGTLGQSRIDKTLKVFDRTELAILVTDNWTVYEEKILAALGEKSIPVIIAANKSDVRKDTKLEQTIKANKLENLVTTDALSGKGIDTLRSMLSEVTPREFIDEPNIIADLVKPGHTVILVTPIDIEAPKGRLKMLQVHCMREILDKNAYCIVTKETELKNVLLNLRYEPDLIVCDSQILTQVTEQIGKELNLTTFSILMARYKGDFQTLIAGAEAIDKLLPGDKVLIAEACSHHPIGDDIGRVQIPNLLKEYADGELDIEVSAGRDFPENLSVYKLVIHCGGCIFNRKEVLSRIAKADLANVPITNYGIAIGYLNHSLERVLLPFKDVMVPDMAKTE
ncbi:MAG: [FeFe] hydrogenase H-cluster maturation GTPase HydF [Sedimentisphaerales bacterium]|nr:[FeFe] hydrogenase H-cluster maturation GTPase HydF [Sedimentisphaerales bacterium]